MALKSQPQEVFEEAFESEGAKATVSRDQRESDVCERLQTIAREICPWNDVG
jgi:hypothetical protein